MRTNGFVFDHNDFVRAKIINSGADLELTLAAYDTEGETVEWQVVEYTGASVQTGDVSFLTTDASKTATLSPAINTAKSWLVYSYSSESGTSDDIGQKLIRGVVTNTTTLTFDRDNTGQTIDLTWYLVEFTDATTVQHASESFSTSDLQKDVTIAAISQAASSFAIGGYLGRSGKTEYNNDDNPGVGWFTLELVNTTTLRIARDEEGSPPPAQASTADIGWFVVEFDDTSVPVTLSGFKSRRSGSGVEFEWETATEAGNVGFQLYEWWGGEWRRVNRELIPGQLDSVEPAQYRYWAEVQGVEFLIADVDIQGQENRHGPFRLGESHGGTLQVSPIDWASVREEAEWQQIHQNRKQQKMLKGRPKITSAGEAGSRSLIWSSGGGPVSPNLQLQVVEEGLYRVSYGALREAGLDLSGVPVAEIALTNRGEPVPIRVRGERTRRISRSQGRRDRGNSLGPGRSEDGFIEFFGERLESLYSAQNVYRLELDASLARRVEVFGGEVVPKGAIPSEYYLETRIEEKERAYSFASPNGDPWYDRAMLAQGSPVEQELVIEAQEVVTGVAPAQLLVGLWGVTDWPDSPDHHVQIEFNGQLVADAWFDGLKDHPITVELPAGLLKEGDNRVRLIVPGDTGAQWDLINLDQYGLRYPRRFLAQEDGLDFEAQGEAFRVEGLPTPEVVGYAVQEDRVVWLPKIDVKQTGGDYAATLPGIEGEARYLITSRESLRTPEIVPVLEAPEIYSGDAELLIITHPNFLEGIQPLVEAREGEGLSVKVVQVTDLYSEFGGGILDPEAIRDYIGYAAENLKTRYVLLVGGDSYDYFDHLELGSMSFIPSLYAPTGLVVNFAPVDPLLTDLDGDGLPDLPIGRFPVRTMAELEAMVEKTLRYGTAGHERTAVFAADREESKISFAEESEKFIEKLPMDWSVQRAYLDWLGAQGARQVLLPALNEGVALTNFFGHSGPSTWTFEQLFSAAEAKELKNRERPLLVIQWGCWNTYHVAPAYNTLGHELLLNPVGGAAAVLGATTLTLAESESQLGSLVLEKLMEPGQRLGAAVQQSKQDLAQSDPELLDVLLGWTLLGDPTLSLQP